MFGFLRMKNDKPLYYKLAKELGTGPMPRSRLVSRYELKYGRKAVEAELDLMVEAGLLFQRPMSFGERVREYPRASPDFRPAILALPMHANQIAA